MRIHYIKRVALSLCAAMSLGLSATSQASQSVTNAQNAQAEPLTPPYSETFADESFLAYIIHSGFISGYQNRYGDNLKPPTNVYHRMTA